LPGLFICEALLIIVIAVGFGQWNKETIKALAKHYLG
jgi:hypothetical protein